ncbi:MAG: anhydro-N-acetylmuramic acid kinase [Proteobacteria bacterium]|nr:anhydro-N-acetylmuramic acid kinase [Pseudomonadota bacterium]
MSTPQYFAGLMSGTSMDAADAALVDFSGAQAKLIATHRTPLTPELRAALLGLCTPGPNEIERMAELDAQMGDIFADSALALLKKAGVKAAEVHAIGSHGQTVRHQPSGPYPFSLQIGNPALIAQRTGITTVADFRRADIAAGGQGAPLVPAFHNAVFRSAEQDRVVVNIGGIANITVLPKDATHSVTGFDTGPGNVLLDAWAERHLGKHMDEDGRFAASGNVREGLLNALSSDDYFALKPPKSTGREHFNMAWLDAALQAHTGDVHGCTNVAGGRTPGATISTQDVQATLCELTAASIAQALRHYAPQTSEVLICGGGAHNVHLMQRLRARLSQCSVESTEKHGINPDWVEAMAFAWLAKQTLESKPGNLPSVTGAKRTVVLGTIYPR